MSTITMEEELTLALQLRDMLYKIEPQNHAIEMVDAVEPELLKLLYAKNKDLADLAYQKLNLLLLQNLDSHNPALPDLQRVLNDLHHRRDQYLSSVNKGFLGFWAEENWTGINLALLALPLFMGSFFPVAGVGLLVYTAVVAASAAVDVARKSPDYWLEESSPDARELSAEQCQALYKQFGDIDFFLPNNHPQKDALKSLDNQSYGLYVLVFGIAVVGLVSLLFPPIGIPALALNVLALVSVVATGIQGYIMIQQHDHILAEIEHETASPAETFTDQDSTTRMNQKLPKTKVIASEVKKTPSVAASTTIKSAPHPSPAPRNEEDDKQGEGPHL